MGLGLRRAALDARDASVGHCHLLGIIARVLTAIGVVGEPFRVDDKRRVGGMSQRLANGIGRKQNVEIGADEAFVRENVVVLPVRVVTEGEFRAGLANLVDLVAADKNNVIETVGTECGDP